MKDLTQWLKAEREKWKYRGDQRPDFAIVPGPNQESVWDYPRPPKMAQDDRHIVVRHKEAIIADTKQAIRVYETASPPTVYIPLKDIDSSLIVPSQSGGSFCEWKGASQYWSVRVEDELIENCGWSYPDPLRGFEPIGGLLSFYPSQLHCTVNGETVQPQPGGFYGGWITKELTGPFKGEPGSSHW